MQHSPLVTVGVPNYNYSHYVLNALNSIISQTYQHLEVIIVDDHSSDNSITVIEDWMKKYNGPAKINFIKNSHTGGLTRVCNQILQNATGKYFQTLDADDMLMPYKIEKQVQLLNSSEDIGFVYSNIGVMDESGNIINPDYLKRIGYNKDEMPEGNIFEKLFDFNFVPLPSVLVNTAHARIVGGFDETLQVQDYYLWLRLSEKFQVKYLSENTALYRVHSTSMSNSTTTNPRSVDSVLNIKFRYYKTANQRIKKIIRKNIFNSVPYLYKYSYPSTKTWIRRNLILNPGIKSLGYYFAIFTGIPYSFFDFIKSKLPTA